MDTDQAIKAAESRMLAAQSEIKRLQERKELEESFGRVGTAYLITRRCIDTGRITGLEGVFTDSAEANRFARSLPGYGVNKDIFIQDLPFYA